MSSSCDLYKPYCNSSLINNGVCDISCMFESCNYDGNDCPSCYSKCFRPGIEQYTGGCRGMNKLTKNWCTVEGVDTCCSSTVDSCCYFDSYTLIGIIIGIIIGILLLLFIFSNICCFENLQPYYVKCHKKLLECLKPKQTRKIEVALNSMSQRRLITSIDQHNDTTTNRDAD